jgi:prefoldin subunit 5
MEKEDIKQEIEYLEKKLTQLHKYIEKLDNNTYTTQSTIKQNIHEPNLTSSSKQHNNQRRKFIC